MCLQSCKQIIWSVYLFIFSDEYFSPWFSRPHAHLKGREIYTSVIRDGREVDYLVNNKYYDFNYQYYNFLKRPLKLQKV